jgi:hypothetical protein
MTDQLETSGDGNTAVLEAGETTGDAPVLTVEKDHKHAAEHRCGYGACSISGCYCQSYSGQAYTCANCGHNYASHW